MSGQIALNKMSLGRRRLDLVEHAFTTYSLSREERNLLCPMALAEPLDDATPGLARLLLKAVQPMVRPVVGDDESVDAAGQSAPGADLRLCGARHSRQGHLVGGHEFLAAGDAGQRDSLRAVATEIMPHRCVSALGVGEAIYVFQAKAGQGRGPTR